jgi:polyphosphate kinase
MSPTTTSQEPVVFNRELSWLAFNDRVLEEAHDESNPLLERVRFATIVASNLDEFFMVRVAGLKSAVAESDHRPHPCGMTPAQQLAAIRERAAPMLNELHALVVGTLLPALAAHGIHIVDVASLDPRSRAAIGAYFQSEVLPALTPLAIDVERPFPMLSALSLNVAFWLSPPGGDGDRRLAVVQLPSRLPRLVRLAGIDAPTFVLLDDVIRAESAALFPGQFFGESAAFRLARDAELELDDEGESFLEAVERSLRQRRRNDVVRLEIAAEASDDAVAHLASLVDVGPDEIYRLPGFLDVRALTVVCDLPGFDTLRFPPAPPVVTIDSVEQDDIFTAIERRDILLHHPYESFDPVAAFVEAAADDPDVLAIKQTLYRTSGDSPIVAALTRAADEGKQVTVLVELMARFDESRNIRWARRLEEMGAHVIYGIRHYKVHAKICLVVRRTKEGLRRYMHLGTGNYNDGTARVYTDMGLLTSDPIIGADASAFWSALTGYSDPPRLRKLVMAPTMLRERLLALIRGERRRAEDGQPARIMAKMNSLVDIEIIRALYEASQAGVQIDLNVRGMCTLKPGVPGMSDHIRVTSIVGRYLEHARIFVFHSGGDEDVYLASADWMPRNLDARVELMFPVEAPAARRKVLDALAALFRDNVKGRRLQPDGSWRKPPLGHADPFEAQAFLHEQALRSVIKDPPPVFEPRTEPDDPRAGR